MVTVGSAAAGRRKRPTAWRAVETCIIWVWWASATALAYVLIVSQTESQIREGTAWRTLPFFVPLCLLFQVAVTLVFRNLRLLQGGTISSFEKMMFRPYEALLKKFILPENTV